MTRHWRETETPNERLVNWTEYNVNWLQKMPCVFGGLIIRMLLKGVVQGLGRLVVLAKVA